jgi:hypothetical protein
MFALISTSGNVIELSDDTTFDSIRVKVGGYAELVHDRFNDSGISAYVDEDARMKTGIEPNPVASFIMGVPLFGDVVMVGLYDSNEERDTALTDEQWRIIREASNS